MEQNVKNNSKVKKIISIVLNVLFYVFIAFLLIFAIANIKGQKNNNIPSLFGNTYMAVKSDSMDGDYKDSFKRGDLIISKTVKEKDIENIKVGDIITFKDYTMPSGTNQVNTHRIVNIDKYEDNGKVYYILQGDKIVYEAKMEKASNESKSDQEKSYTWQSKLYVKDEPVTSTISENIQTIESDKILAVYKGKIKGAGKTLEFLQSKTGFGLCIVLPTCLLLLFEGYVLVRNILILNKQKMEETLKVKDEEQKKALEIEKEKIRQELLAEMANKDNKTE